MAQRFGGKFSPDANRPDTGPETGHAPQAVAGAPAGHQARTWFLFAVPLIFAFNAFRGDPRGLIFGLVTCGVLLLAAWLTREGIRAQAEYDARRVARRPALPRKLIASGLTGLGLVLGGMIAQPGLLYPILFGLLGAALHFGAFGADPLAGKGMEGMDQFQTDRVARAVTEAEAHLAGMKDAILRAGDRSLEARVEQFAAAARVLFRSVESDPGDLTAARKYLSVYLMGARDATVKFADIYAQSRDPKPRADYEALLTDLETNFASRTKALLANNSTGLDIEIAVLRDRLKLEG
jgi:hypothetical protein